MARRFLPFGGLSHLSKGCWISGKRIIGQIGMVGFALEQTISMINFIAQLRGDVGTENVDRLERN